MTSSHDEPNAMQNDKLTRKHVEALLNGESAENLPSAGAVVASIVATLRTPAKHDDNGLSYTVAAMAQAMHGERKSTPMLWRSKMLLAALQAKVFALVVGGALVATTGLAAADALPTPVQRVTSNALDNVGIHVPNDEAQSNQSTADLNNVDNNNADHGKTGDAVENDHQDATETTDVQSENNATGDNQVGSTDSSGQQHEGDKSSSGSDGSGNNMDTGTTQQSDNHSSDSSGSSGQ